VLIEVFGRLGMFADFYQHLRGALPVFCLEIHVGRVLPLLELLVECGGGNVIFRLDVHIDGLGVPLRLFVEARRPS